MLKFIGYFCLLAVLGFADDSLQLEYQILDRIALESGTDKSSNSHNYTEIYAEYFAPFRDQPIKFLEIGISTGCSAWLWDRYFTNAELHLIDNRLELLQHSKPERAHYHIVDQADAKALKRFAASVGGNFDIIIDDGGHYMDQQIISFQTLFPFLRSGGLYIVEDLHTSYWRQFGGGGTAENPKAGEGTAVEFLKNLVEDLNYTSGLTACGDWKKTPKEIWMHLSEFQKHIHSIHFYKSLCIIKKH